ncbi:hypothetical protein NPIL_330941 [Nephila pilipes]|uniref:Uncharacterized protein n=1 Tax=Nephila pilipes TaxID=299642 RepID=A0A8X6UB76_NEPPI|nr:hypothetical protein NPIL_330941 [Nephila pilipes]
MPCQSARAPFAKRPQGSFPPNCEQPPNDFCRTIMLMTEDNQSHYHGSTMSERRSSQAHRGLEEIEQLDCVGFSNESYALVGYNYAGIEP